MNFKDRLVEEKVELLQKIEKLKAFQSSEGFHNIPEVQQTLINIQLCAMYTYAQVLLERIALIDFSK